MAVIIDDEGPPEEIVDNEQDIAAVKLNQPANTLKQALKIQGQLVLAFNGLSIQAVTHLLIAITSTIKSSQLAAFSLIILTKENDYKDILISIREIFEPWSKVPKIFFTHINSSSKVDAILPELPQLNSIGCAVKSSSSSAVVKLFTEAIEDSFTKLITVCFEEMRKKLVRKSSVQLYKETFGKNRTVFPPIYMPDTSK